MARGRVGRPWNSVAVEETQEDSENSAEPRIVKFADDPARSAALARWKVIRDQWVEGEKPLAQQMSDVDGRVIGRCSEESDEGGFHPVINGSTSGFLKRLVVQLSPRGEFLEDQAPNKDASDPCIGRDPVLFLRARNLGFAAAIEGILADLRTRQDLPWSLLNIAGEESPISEVGDWDLPTNTIHPDGEVLLSKPANPEQIRIAQQLEEHGGVFDARPSRHGKNANDRQSCWPFARSGQERAGHEPHDPKHCGWCAITLFPSYARCASACWKVTWIAASSSIFQQSNPRRFRNWKPNVWRC